MRVVVVTLALTLVASSAMAVGSATDGQRDFSRCAACHAIKKGSNGIGPSLASVVGREAGTESGYSFSPAMASVKITWDDASLDRFLANPQSVVHGTKMYIAIPDARQRKDIIAYLNTLK
jgi:cytochrome c2